MEKEIDILEGFKNGYKGIRDLYNYYNKNLDLLLESLRYWGIDLLDCDIKEIEKIRKEEVE